MNAISADSPLAIAQRVILEPSNLSIERVEHALAVMHEHELDEAEAWREATDPTEAGRLVDGIILLTGLARDAEGRDPNSSASAPS